MNAKGYIIVVVIAVALGAWLWMKPAAAPAMPDNNLKNTAVGEPVSADTVEQEELNALDIPETDFSEIDADTQTL